MNNETKRFYDVAYVEGHATRYGDVDLLSARNAELWQRTSAWLTETGLAQKADAKIFKVVATNGDIDWVITNRAPRSINTSVVQNENQRRWVIEQLHRELKQLTGIEKCQCPKQRAQRNHFFCCYQAWFSLKVVAKKLRKTLYQVKQNLWSEYLRSELRQPHIPVYQPA